MIARLALLVFFTLLPGAARAEKLISVLSNDTVQVTSAFAGETLTLFGSIEPDTGSELPYVEGPFHVVIVVEGPLFDRVARRKSNLFGIWLNTDQVIFENFPSFFRVLSSGRLSGITDPATLAVNAILPEAQARYSGSASWWDSVVFGQALVRLMTEKGHFGLNESGVRFLSDTSYAARLALPHDIANGPFIAHTFVFKDGAIVAKTSDGFAVRKIGFERFIYIAALQYPLLYGLIGVVLALFTGWLGGVIFKR